MLHSSLSKFYFHFHFQLIVFLLTSIFSDVFLFVSSDHFNCFFLLLPPTICLSYFFYLLSITPWSFSLQLLSLFTSHPISLFLFYDFPADTFNHFYFLPRLYFIIFFSTSMMPSFFNGRFLTIPSVLPFSSHSPNFACSHIPFRFHSSIKWDYFTCNQPFLQALSLPTLSFTRFPSLDCSTKLGSWPIFFALSEIHIIDQKEKNK